MCVRTHRAEAEAVGHVGAAPDARSTDNIRLAHQPQPLLVLGRDLRCISAQAVLAARRLAKREAVLGQLGPYGLCPSKPYHADALRRETLE